MTDNTDGQRRTGSCAVAVVGGGTAGLALATELKQQGIDDVLVIEREASAGGVPRHCGHYPFGVTEFKRLLKGPAYAQRLIDKATCQMIVSHSLDTIRSLCTRVILVESGKIVMDDKPDVVVKEYIQSVRGEGETPMAAQVNSLSPGGRALQ